MLSMLGSGTVWCTDSRKTGLGLAFLLLTSRGGFGLKLTLAGPGTVMMIAVMLLILARPASANGGTVQLSREAAGPFEVTVWTDPNPVRVGTVDISAMVERPGGELVQDARVFVMAQPDGDAGAGGAYEATHDLATNKLFYAAHVPISRAGQWQIEVTIIGSTGEGTVSFMLEAEEPGVLERPLTRVLVGAGLVLAGLVWRLQRRTRKCRSG